MKRWQSHIRYPSSELHSKTNYCAYETGMYRHGHYPQHAAKISLGLQKYYTGLLNVYKKSSSCLGAPPAQKMLCISLKKLSAHVKLAIEVNSPLLDSFEYRLEQNGK